MRPLALALLSIVWLPVLCATTSAMPCFPGAEGFGTETPGGRGGRVIAVTSLRDSGPGTLREACEAKGPRTVVFRVSGYIRLKRALRITEPFITIAGQSAPGQGICLRDAYLSVETHDVVIRFIRVRIGASLNEPPDAQNCIEIKGDEAYNVVVDHCSFSWGIDENVGIVSRAHDVTFSYNIVSEALRQPFTAEQIGKERSHSMGMILGNYPDRTSVHHNLISHCNSRNPRIQGGTHDFVNNVIYDWGGLTAAFSRNPNVNFIGNYYKPGPSSTRRKAIVDWGEDMGRVYVNGNVTPDWPKEGISEWEGITDAPETFRAETPFETAPLSIRSADEAYERVLSSAGCRLPAFDEVDSRVIRQARLGFGVKIDRPEEVGGFPRLKVVRGPKDSDGDGIPDEWENAHGLDSENSSDGSADRDGDGYTNLEEYLNSLVDIWEARFPKVITYPVPDSVADSPYVVEVNGIAVPIERAGAAFYARFQFALKVRGSVRIGSSGAVSVELEPKRYQDNVGVAAKGLSFDISEPGPRILTFTVNGVEQPPLFVLADSYESGTPKPGDRGVIDVAEYGVTSEGIQTANIQKALDACAAQRTGGVVYFGPGVYRTGTIRIRDNTTVYLAPGALIVGSEDAADYPVDEGRLEQGSHGPVSSFSRLLMFDNCRNSKLTGYGVIDGMGHIVRNKHGRHVQLVDVTGSTNITIENVVLRNSAEWTVHILGCEDVTVKNLKILNDWTVGNTDGINPDGSRNVSISQYFGYCGDDAIAIKTTGNSGYLKPSENIRVRDSVVVTRKTAYKIGTETYADVRNVLFEACDAVNCSRGIGLWMRDGSTISDVTYRDITLDLRELPAEGMSGEPYRATIEDRNGVGKIRDILFDRVQCRAPYGSVFAGMPQSKIERVNMWGCRWQCAPRKLKLGRRPVLELGNVSEFVLKHCELEWPYDQLELWDGFIRQVESEGVYNENFVERHASSE